MKSEVTSSVGQLGPATARVAVIGDVGGHRRCLHSALREFGADPEANLLPDGLTVIQVGDLVGGPQDDAVVADVQSWIDRYPDRWIQLIGNHEAQHLGGPQFFSKTRQSTTSPATVEALRSMSQDGTLRAAACLRTSQGEDVLVTHAGVSAGYWERDLGSETDATQTGELLNRMLHHLPLVLYRPGTMLSGWHNPHQLPAGPMWAMAAVEVYESWLDHPMPFGQIHGHTSPFWFNRGRWQDEISDRVRQRGEVKRDRRHVWLNLGGRRIVAIDPGLGRSPRGDELHALVLHAEVVAASDNGSSDVEALPAWLQKWNGLGERGRVIPQAGAAHRLALRPRRPPR